MFTVTSKVLIVVICSVASAWLTAKIIQRIKYYIKSQEEAKQKNADLNELKLLAQASGFLEVFLYSTSFLIGKPEFILVWVGIKTALRWDRKYRKKDPAFNIRNRGLYYSFLIGSGLNIILGYVIASLASWEFITY